MMMMSSTIVNEMARLYTFQLFQIADISSAKSCFPEINEEEVSP
jgi:hypothetical protein